ncbi:endonuclease V [Flavobacterium rivuli]|uniref:endonuclease V n=1 Tax=Flavobacterium rivuli TaxID=498301 RepID=UPI0003AA014B|nr:endonuclease V [Flavobacterium rivuli]
MSVLAIDVYYRPNDAKAVGVIFNWEDAKPTETVVEYIKGVGDYVPGEFYKRELPCIQHIFEVVNLNTIDAIIIDGHMYVDNAVVLG